MNRQKIEHALVDLLAEQVKHTTLAGCMLITLVGIVMWFSFPPPQVAGWVFFGYAIAVPRYLVITRVKNALSEGDSRLTLEIIIAAALFLSGLHWGMAAWLFLDTSDTQDFALVCGAILGVIASSLSIFSTRPLICCLFAITVFSITALKLALVGNWGLFVMCLMVLPPYAITSRTLGRRIEKSISQDFLNAELLVEVSAAKDAAEKANRDKSLFMTATSHDLRQPLHAQSLFLQLMSRKSEGTELAELTRKMQVSNNALIALFDALLEVSQLDAGTIQVRAEHHRLSETANLILQEFQESATQKGLSLNLVCPECVVYSDPILLMRILRNLVSNAIKFTHEGDVTLKITLDEPQVIVSVCDTGVGIPKAEQGTIFNEYTQLDNPARDRSKGIGLGLALVRRMCDLLDHELTLESRLGEGSCFHITVPAGNAANIVELSRESVTNQIRGLDIMIIDDEQQILDAMQALFTDWSCRARTYTNLADALRAVEQQGHHPDMIISDYRLNEKANGVEAISQLRALLSYEVPAIIISGDTDPRLLESIQSEDFYLLHKPVSVAKLRKVMSSLLKRPA